MASQPAQIVSNSPLELTEPTEIATEIPTPAPIEFATSIPLPKPKHYFDSSEGSTYYYGAAVSEEQRKTGKIAPDMLAFWYLGKNAQGQDMVQNVTNSRNYAISTCARPCKVIHNNDGTSTGYNESSIIGAVFADAQRGFLKKYVLPQQKVEPWISDPNVVEPEQPSRSGE